MPKFDYSPRVFLRVMRWEVLIVFGSIAMGLMLPSIFRKQYDYDRNMVKNST